MEQLFSGKSVRKLFTTSRGSPLFPFVTERWKFPCHLVNFLVSSLSSAETNLLAVCLLWKIPNHYSTAIPTGSFWQMVSTFGATFGSRSVSRFAVCSTRSKLLQWIYCDDNSSLSSTTAVQIWTISYKLHIISLHGKINWPRSQCVAS